MKNRIRRNFKRFLFVCPVLMVILVIIQLVSIYRFNSHVYSVKGVDDSIGTWMDLDSRKDSTSSWLKRDFIWGGETLDLRAQTIDGILNNNSKDTVDKWTLRIDITKDCFINNAWCGTMEIHQYTGTEKETVQLLDLRNYKLEDVKFEYFFDGDLLIPLQPGDYIIYSPSLKDGEMPVEPNSGITMGVIFYYFDSLDFYNYQIDFTYHRDFSYGVLYKVIMITAGLWLIGITIYVISMQFYKDAQKQLELKKSGLLSMSDIYMAIYMINIEQNEIIPVVENDSESIARPKEVGANEQLRYLFAQDATKAYRQLAMDFCNVSTLAERMQDKNSIAFEYVSKRLGWCSIRFFALDRIEGQMPERALFTIQVIDSEKREMKAIEDRISQAEEEAQANGTVLHSIAEEIIKPAQNVLYLNDKIIEGCGGEAVVKYAKEIKNNGNKLVEIIRDLLDYSRIELGRLNIKDQPVSLKSVLYSIRDHAADIIDENKHVKLQFDIAPTVPEKINGDEEQLTRVLNILLTAADERTKEGSISISLFGKEYDENVHLVFSVRDTGNGEAEVENVGIGLRLATALLKRMGSELKIINSPQNGTETYFELETIAIGTGTLGQAGLEL